MFKNVASQQIVLLAIDTATNTPKTGDAANITAYLSKDYGTVTVLGDTSATEMDATNAPGLYKFDVTQTESNCDVAVFSGKSSTSGIRIIPVTVFMRPANMTAMSIDSSGRLDMAKLAGQTITAGAGVTFPSSIASPTNITAATGVTLAAVTHTGAVIPTVTTVTNQLTAAAISTQVLTDLGTGSGLTSLAPASTALSTVVWTSTIAGRIDAAISSRLASASYSAPPSAATISTQVQTDLGTGAALTSLASQSSVNTLAGYVDTEVAAIKAKTDNLPAQPAAVGDIPTAIQNANALLGLADGIETGLTPLQCFRLIVSATAGKVSGADGTTVTFRDIADTKDRMVVTVDASGNRTAFTRDLT